MSQSSGSTKLPAAPGSTPKAAGAPVPVTPHSALPTPHSPTPARLAANRANAQKSTGPRTPEGKARSRMNGLKHGLNAEQRFITLGDAAEDPREFTEIHADLRRIYNPEGPRQDALVERIADATWRLLRVQRFEIGAVHRRIAVPDQLETIDLAALENQIEQTEGRVAYYEQLTHSPSPDPGMPVPELERLLHDAKLEALSTSEDVPRRFKLLGMFAAAMGTEPKPTGRTAEDLHAELLNTLRPLIRREKSKLVQLRADRDRAALQAEFLAQRDRLLHALPDAQDAWTVIRYETMLTRIRDKAVADLDRLKQWGENE